MSGGRSFPRSVVLALVGMVVLLSQGAEGQVFRYVDPDGVIHYSDGRRDARFERADGYGGNSSPPPPPEAPSQGTLTDYIEGVATQYDLDPRLVKAVIRAESNFDPWAVSPKGAMGLMQLMPETARSYSVSNPFDPYQNIQGGARHLRYLLNLYGEDVELALAAYNAGQERVQQYRGVPPFPETQRYIRRILDSLPLRAVVGGPKNRSVVSTKGGGIYRYVGPDGVTLFTDTPR